jgi:hypothetical protein
MTRQQKMFSARSTDLESGRAEQARKEEEEEEEEEQKKRRRKRRSGSDCATAAALRGDKGKRASFGSRMRSPNKRGSRNPSPRHIMTVGSTNGTWRTNCSADSGIRAILL